MKNRSILTRSIINTLFFVLGFSLIFVTLGAGAGSFSRFLLYHKTLISVVGGSVIIVLSLHIMGLFTVPFLNFEKKVHLARSPGGIIGAFVIGITFAVAWTPCIGPILSSILILAATEDTASKGAVLLAVYSIGLGLPFMFAVIAYSSFITFSGFIRKHYRSVKFISGILLFGVGLILILGQFEKLSQYISFIPDISMIKSNNINLFIALIAGTVSFISPCVLPLIPSYLAFITGESVLELD